MFNIMKSLKIGIIASPETVNLYALNLVLFSDVSNSNEVFFPQKRARKMFNILKLLKIGLIAFLETADSNARDFK